MNNIFTDNISNAQTLHNPPEVTMRKLGEAVHTTLGTVASAVSFPLGLYKFDLYTNNSLLVAQHEVIINVSFCCTCLHSCLCLIGSPLSADYLQTMDLHYCRLLTWYYKTFWKYVLQFLCSSYIISCNSCHVLSCW